MKTKNTNCNDEQKLNLIINTTCQLHEIDKEQLLSNANEKTTDLRKQCFYLIKTNTMLSINEISSLLNVSRKKVNIGIETIKAHKNIYTNTMSSLLNIVSTANEKHLIRLN